MPAQNTVKMALFNRNYFHSYELTTFYYLDAYSVEIVWGIRGPFGKFEA